MKAAEEEAIGGFEIPTLLLMEHAALALANHLENRFGALLRKTRGIVLAGNGNNGGDALAATRLLFERGCHNIFVVLPSAKSPRSESTQKQLALLARLGFAWGTELSDDLLGASDWILDGLFGTGLSRPIEGEYLERIECINRFAEKKWIVSARWRRCTCGYPPAFRTRVP
jgi:NAD(P)H-hydrate epimerase